MEHQTDGWIGAASAVLQTLSWSVVVKRELRCLAKLSVYQLVPTLSFGQEL